MTKTPRGRYSQELRQQAVTINLVQKSGYGHADCRLTLRTNLAT